MNHNNRKKTAKTLGALGAAAYLWLKQWGKNKDEATSSSESNLPPSQLESLPNVVPQAEKFHLSDALKAPAKTFMDLAESDIGKAVALAGKALSIASTAGRVGFALWDIFSPSRRHERAVEAARKTIDDASAYEYLESIARFSKQISTPSRENNTINRLVYYMVAEILDNITKPETSPEYNHLTKDIIDAAISGDGYESMAARLAITQASTISSKQAAEYYSKNCDYELFDTIGRIRLEAYQKDLIELAKERVRNERTQARAIQRELAPLRDLASQRQREVVDEYVHPAKRMRNEAVEDDDETNRRLTALRFGSDDEMEESTHETAPTNVGEADDDELYDELNRRLDALRARVSADDALYDTVSERLSKLTKPRPPRERRKKVTSTLSRIERAGKTAQRVGKTAQRVQRVTKVAIPTIRRVRRVRKGVQALNNTMQKIGFGEINKQNAYKNMNMQQRMAYVRSFKKH